MLEQIYHYIITTKILNEKLFYCGFDGWKTIEKYDNVKKFDFCDYAMNEAQTLLNDDIVIVIIEKVTESYEDGEFIKATSEEFLNARNKS